MRYWAGSQYIEARSEHSRSVSDARARGQLVASATVRKEAGQATVEWSALALVVALALAVVGYATIRLDASKLADALIAAIVCATGDECPDALDDAYGKEVAQKVRKYTPNIVYERSSAELPIDFRRCRELACSNGSDRAVAMAESALGLPVTAFTHVVDRRSRGGSLYLQYWLYFPESFTGGLGRKLGPLAHRWPGYHRDDWEGAQVRISLDGRISARASAHGAYRNFKHSDGWGPWTGWYRVSGGSHAGHLVWRPENERTTPADSLSLVPLESLGAADLYRFEISPPWRKQVYVNPEWAGS